MRWSIDGSHGNVICFGCLDCHTPSPVQEKMNQTENISSTGIYLIEIFLLTVNSRYRIQVFLQSILGLRGSYDNRNSQEKKKCNYFNKEIVSSGSPHRPKCIANVLNPRWSITSITHKVCSFLQGASFSFTCLSQIPPSNKCFANGSQ